MERFSLHVHRLLLTAVSLLFAVTVVAQDDIGNKLSITTQMFLQERDGKIDLNPNLKGFSKLGIDTLQLSDNWSKRLIASPTVIGGKSYISAFVRVEDASALSQLEQKGVIVRNGFNNGLYTTYIPVDSIESVATIGNVKKIKVAELKRKATDKARQATNVDDVLTNSADAVAAGLSTKYDGKGVVVAVIDEGIDFGHKAFQDASGNSRIKRVYAKTSSNGTAEEYTNSSSFPSTDNSSEDHGTHTSTTAGGSSVIVNGTSVTVTDDHSKATYGGMAPNSDLYLVGTYDLDETVISDGFAKAVQYADSINEPIVVSNSWGASIGPRDGTGETADVVNTYFGDSHPNHVCLFAASNDAGNGGMYVGGTASSSSPLSTILKSSYSNYYYGIVADIWTRTAISGNLTVKVFTVSSSGTVSNTRTLSSSSLSSNGTSVSVGNFSFYAYKNVVSSDKTEIVFYFSSARQVSGSYLGIQVYPSSGSCTVDMWTPSGYNYFDNSPSVSGYTWTDGTDDSSVSNEPTIQNAIAIGAYVSKNSVTDYNGSTHSLASSYPNVGDIASFSSYQTEGTGPTGALLPWITAPGATIVSGVNSNSTSTYGTSTYNGYGMYKVVNNSSAPYGNMDGTSMATPCAAGIVALWLQAAKETGHELTHSEVKTIMKETAITDSYTTTGSNHTHFGNGKINALDGIKYILNTWGSTDPTLSVDTTALAFTGNLNKTTSKTIHVTKANLTGNVTATLSGTNARVFAVSPTSIESADGTAEVTVSFTPTSLGTFTGTLTFSSDGAESKTVALTGTAAATLTADPTSLTFTAAPGSTSTQTVSVAQTNLTSDVKVAVSGNGFTVSPTTISASADTTELTVTFAPTAEGNYTGTLTLTSGSLTATVALSGTSNDGGTASDAYLNVAKYSTIDEAGWATSSVDKYYTYTEYEDDGVAWLTVPSYGVMQSTSNQKWTAASSASSYSSSWSATDIFPASSTYFTSTTARAVYNSSGAASQTFYVTNTTAVKGYGYNYSSWGSSSSSLTLNVYECTLGSDGSLTASTTAAGTASNSTSSYRGVITVDGLDANKIYQVVFSANNNADGYAVAFQTPLNVVKTPTLSATPTELTFETEANTPVTQTFTVNGTNLTGNVTATLSDENNVYSLSATSVTVTEATAGKEITVTFSPTEAGTFTGTVTLSSDGATAVTVALNGTATEQTSPVRYKSTADDTWHYLLPDENGAYNITDGAYYAFEVMEDVPDATVNYTRTLTAGNWYAWLLPIDYIIPDDAYKFGYLEGCYGNIEQNNMKGAYMGVMQLSVGGTVKANLPYVIKPSVSGTYTFTLTGTLKQTNPTSTTIEGNAYDYTSTGIYTTKTASSTDNGWYGLGTDGKFSLQDGTVANKLKPFRFYLSITDHAGNPYLSKMDTFELVDLSDVTGITRIDREDNSNDIIYDLQGRRVNKPTHGIYIVNGRKVVFK